MAFITGLVGAIGFEPTVSPSGDMLPLPTRYAPFAYGVIQAAITTAVATGIATGQLTDLGLGFLERWALAWLMAWLSMLPVVILVAPLIERAVRALTAPDPAQRRPGPGA